mgnify:CR=1 FL=1
MCRRKPHLVCWQICSSKKCGMVQQQQQRGTRQRALTIALRAKGGGLDGLLVLLFGLTLSRGGNVGVYDASVQHAIPFKACLPSGCVVPLSCDPRRGQLDGEGRHLIGRCRRRQRRNQNSELASGFFGGQGPDHQPTRHNVDMRLPNIPIPDVIPPIHIGESDRQIDVFPSIWWSHYVRQTHQCRCAAGTPSAPPTQFEPPSIELAGPPGLPRVPGGPFSPSAKRIGADQN